MKSIVHGLSLARTDLCMKLFNMAFSSVCPSMYIIKDGEWMGWILLSKKINMLFIVNKVSNGLLHGPPTHWHLWKKIRKKTLSTNRMVKKNVCI